MTDEKIIEKWRQALQMHSKPSRLAKLIALQLVDELEKDGVTEADIDRLFPDRVRAWPPASPAIDGIDDHEQPRYTTRRLRYEIDRAVQAALDAAPPAPVPAVGEREQELLRVLRLFREFWMFYVTQTKLGASHHHPMWAEVAKALGGDYVEAMTPEEWDFITGPHFKTERPFPDAALTGETSK